MTRRNEEVEKRSEKKTRQARQSRERTKSRDGQRVRVTEARIEKVEERTEPPFETPRPAGKK